jgi:hypothetical protein
MAALSGCQQPRTDLTDRLLIGEVMMHAEFAGNLRALAMPGGRLTGTPNAEHAADFVAAKLRAYGLKNVQFEPFEMNCWTVRQTRVAVLDESAPPCVLDGAIALARTMPTPPDGITAELIDCGDGKDEDFAAHGDEVVGKFALVRDNHWRGPKLKQAIQRGAAGLVVMAAADGHPTIGNGHRTPGAEPAVVIPHDDELLERLARGERVRVNIQLETENWVCHPRNVSGEIPGRGAAAREIVIVCAHLDSWHLAEGGMDNGSGSATILETARALARVNSSARRTIRFIWFMGEEQGLEGSEAYVREHRDEMDRIVAVINVDMPGAPRNLVVFGHEEVVPFLQGVRADLAAYEMDPNITVTPGGDGSDHAPFVHQGVCGLAIGGELGPGVKGYHTAGDTYESVDRRGTVQTSAVLAVLARRLADAPERPTRRAVPTTP